MRNAEELLLRAIREGEARKREGWRLFRAQPHQRRALESRARRLLIFGGNQSGKTLCAAARLAYQLLGEHGWTQPRSFLCVSLDLSLMSANIYEKLFEPGAFDICKQCLKPRHLCEDEGACGADGSTFRDRAIPAEPLIPRRLLDTRHAKDGFAWHDRSRNQPAACWIKGVNGRSPVCGTFRSTDQGRSKFQGPQWDVVWADEEASNDSSVMFEIERGLIKRQGMFTISATPLAASATIFRWHEKAVRDAARAQVAGEVGHRWEPFYEEVRLPTRSNRALDQRDIDRFAEEMSEDERNVRLEGDFVILQGLVYGKEWGEHHLVEPRPIAEDWTIYTIEDPGTASVYAVLFWAVDPEGNHWLWDEIYVPRSNLPELVRLKKEKLSHKNPVLCGIGRKPQRMYADPAVNTPHHGARRVETLKTLLVREHKRQNLGAWDGGPNVYEARNAVQAGIFAVKGLLEARNKAGEPLLRVFRTLRYFRREIALYRWPPPTLDKDVKEKAGPLKKDDHLMDCFRYGALAGLAWVSPEQRKSRVPPHLEEAWQRKLRKRRRKAALDRAKQMSMS